VTLYLGIAFDKTVGSKGVFSRVSVTSYRHSKNILSHLYELLSISQQ
jgi:hypothetical protein